MSGCNTIVISGAARYNPCMYEAVHHRLKAWYEQHGRHELPWRKTDDPYRIWVSEIMLQQTQVKTVLERFYFPFLDRFPTLQSLTAAPLDDVLKQWEGLGYYTRARNLHKAAKLCNPFMPETVERLQKLPGIGKSTAHAIAAFAHRTPVPILDANVKRILYRFFGRRNADEKTLWRLAYKLFDPKHPFEYNQAMMDVGATLCMPRQARCGACPLQPECKAALRDPLHYPEKGMRKKVPLRRRHILVYIQGGRFGLKQRSGRFLHGLWGFIEQEEPPEVSAQKIGTVTQVYSHFRLEGTVWRIEAHCDHLEYFTEVEIDALALSASDHKVIALL